MKIACAILAAGRSTRMRGKDKLLELVDGMPLLKRQALVCAAMFDKVLVTVPSLEHPRCSIIEDLDVIPMPISNANLGMSESLKSAVLWAATNYVDHFVILPADMPDITQSDLRKIKDKVSAFPKSIIQATSADQKPGHPVSFPRALFHAFSELEGDTGAKSILNDNNDLVRYVNLPDEHATTDLDTPEAWERWKLVRSNST